MKKLAALLMLATVLGSPGVAFARDIAIDAQLVGYSGPAAYLAVYVTKPNGSYHSTLWVSGGKTKYYRHLREWARGVSASGERIDGVTGASVGSGRSLHIDASIADALIDAGYEIHIDSAVEDGGAFPADARVPLSQAGAGVPIAGSGYVSSIVVKM